MSTIDHFKCEANILYLEFHGGFYFIKMVAYNLTNLVDISDGWIVEKDHEPSMN